VRVRGRGHALVRAKAVRTPILRWASMEWTNDEAPTKKNPMCIAYILRARTAEVPVDLGEQAF
jgi:hypothetical protein